MKTQHLTLICITLLSLAVVFGSDVDPEKVLLPAVIGLIGYLNQEKA